MITSKKVLEQLAHTENERIENTKHGKLLTMHDLREIFQLSRQAIMLWAKRGILKPIKISNSVFYLTEDIDSLIDSHVSKQA